MLFVSFAQFFFLLVSGYSTTSIMGGEGPGRDKRLSLLLFIARFLACYHTREKALACKRNFGLQEELTRGGAMAPRVGVQLPPLSNNSAHVLLLMATYQSQLTVIVAGDWGVGKSSFVRRYRQSFTDYDWSPKSSRTCQEVLNSDQSVYCRSNVLRSRTLLARQRR